MNYHVSLESLAQRLAEAQQEYASTQFDPPAKAWNRLSDHERARKIKKTLGLLLAARNEGYLVLQIPPEWAPSLEALVDPANGLPDLEAVVLRLLDHAQAGVRRSESRERGWVDAAFGSAWRIPGRTEEPAP